MHVYVARIIGAGINSAGKVTRLFQDKTAAQDWLRVRMPVSSMQDPPDTGETMTLEAGHTFELKCLKVN